jgi:hypothetical protein
MQAAFWAAREFPEWSAVIEQARTWRESPETGSLSPDAVDFVNVTIQETIE